MINSRDLDDLHPKVAAMARELIERCQAEGIDLLVTSTYRDAEAQASLYQGCSMLNALVVQDLVQFDGVVVESGTDIGLAVVA